MLGNAQEDSVRRARAALLASPVPALRDLKVDAFAEKLIISGSVHCFYHKQLAQEVIRNAVDGIRVVNAVSVEDGGQRADNAYWNDEPSFIG